jgi:hypothetical protein
MRSLDRHSVGRLSWPESPDGHQSVAGSRRQPRRRQRSERRRKSTLLKAIAGLARAAGRVKLGGAYLIQQSLSPRGRDVAHLPQSLPQPTPLVAYEAA